MNVAVSLWYAASLVEEGIRRGQRPFETFIHVQQVFHVSCISSNGNMAKSTLIHLLI